MVGRRLVAIGLPLALMSLLLVAWAAWADTPPDGVAQYVITVPEPGMERAEISLPEGFEYVGLAAGSEWASEPDLFERGTRLVWEGPLAAGTIVRFWVALPLSTTAPDSLPLAGADLSAVRTEPLITTPASRSAGPDDAPAQSVTVVKTVDPEELEPGESRWVTYEVVFTNDGAPGAVLDRITDTLPAGFQFGGMAYGSDVGEPIDDEEPEIVWDAATVPANGTLTLAYNARAVDWAGAYENSVVAAMGEESVGPASATVEVKGGRIFLPMLIHEYPEIPGLPLPFRDDFVDSDLPNWEEFDNWPGLSPELWYWSGQDGVWGLYNYEYDATDPAYEGYNLTVMNATGAELWTDYRVEARIKDIKETNQNKGMAGIWFRGTYEDSGTLDGKTVSGYYFYMRLVKEGTDTLFLMRTTPGNPSFASQEVVASTPSPFPLGRTHWYKVIVEVRGSNIKVWLEDDEDGVADPVQVFNWTDPDATWPSGTVGLATYNTSARYDYIYVLP